MTRVISIWFLVALTASGSMINAQPNSELTADICILGGSEAGFTAAIQAARQDASVILIEPSGHPGGMMVEGIVKDIRFGSSVVIAGIAKELYILLESHYGGTPRFDALDWYCPYEPSVAEFYIEKLLAQEKNIRIIRQARIKEINGVEKKQQTIQSINLDNGAVIHAKIFIDASIEGDLIHLAGITNETIREGNDRYKESKNGIQLENNYRQFTVKVDPYVIPGNSHSGLIPTIQPGEIGEYGQSDKHIMGYCFRLCLTREEDNRIEIEKPANYNPFTYEIYRRYLAAGGQLFHPRVNRQNGKTDLGSWHDLSANLYGENWQYPAGNYAIRDSIVQYHQDFTHGLIWFLQNDPDVDSLTSENWKGWGLCKDEFMDNGGWPRRIYVRSARRMVSDYIITEHHTRRTNPELVPDPVVLAWWPPDTHHARRIVRDGYAYNEGFVFGGNDWRPFGISWRALLPKSSECTNLITPTCPSSSYVAYGAIRILPTFLMLGQSAGVAAALSVQMQIPPQKLVYKTLRKELDTLGFILQLPDDWEMRVASEN